jgi:sulfur carrier protein
MQIQVNGEIREVVTGCSVIGLLQTVGVDGDGVAVALNGSVLGQGQWTVSVLVPGDVVEIVRAVGGG